MTRNPSAPDSPAPHSMNTDGLAVDRDGRVALSASGENGAVVDGAARRAMPVASDVSATPR